MMTVCINIVLSLMERYMSSLPVHPLRLLAVVLLAALLFTFALPAGAQDELRAPPSNDFHFNAKAAVLPFSEVVGTISEATIEANETQPCIGGTGEHSVWYRVTLPAGGTLVVDTTGSNYDTVVSVWVVTIETGTEGLTNLDCEDDGTAAALLRYPVAASGEMLISVSEVPTVPVRAPQSLVIAIDYEVPNALKPAGSDLDHAITAKLNKPTTLTGLEYAIGHDPVVGAPVCSTHTQYPVWFRITVPFDMIVNINSDGSFFQIDQSIANTMTLDLFEEGFDNTADSLDCGTTGSASGAELAGIGLQKDKVYYLRAIRPVQSTNLSGPSRYRISVNLRDTDNVLINGDFEDPTPMLGWKVKNATGDGPGSLFGSGFIFVGNPGENSQLHQTVTLPAPLALNDSMSMLYIHEQTGQQIGTPVTAILKLTYSDGSVRTFKQKTFTKSGGTVEMRMAIQPPKGSLTKIKVAVKFKATSGTVFVDNFDLTFRNFDFREANAALPLPLPPAR